ncbi:sodium-dependent transporter [Campylobacter sp. VicNov18]|uniref:sodium-dependent transporter n=1 Tax=Campylobacter bilis TaxID=2691918 RepID=UPI00130DDF74|nr:sodium-dependent transporter [Campylobacter bilis]MPV63887.1 sodium-dependent transporter [Campylobacter hepaticus]MBM0637388.1 sodium-dependent transporter [Campylobacter bilis]MCC8278109.1 sodium-dependent transporter [Campylobacter bilis]MCC8299613.1 sodium-dependent transporter [Campylobacter bilis]MCC8301018.1 sodium-dependent transporter [Campylobacter bilis]
MRTYFSKIGFILAVAGGAIGLGNAWKFPTLSAENGGFIFVLLYLFFTLSIGFSIFLAEVAMGRLSKSDLANAYSSLAISHGKRWRYAGIFMLGGIFVLSFYLVIMGWVLKYTLSSLYYLPKSLEEAKINFHTLISSDLSSSAFFFILSFFLTLFIVSKGLIKGIEKLNLIIMPILFLMLLFMLFYCMSFQKSFARAFSYLFYPNILYFKLSSIAEALGLAFFTLCLGIGCIVTYSAALNKKTNFIRSSVYIVLINLFISFIMGIIVFTFIFEFGTHPYTEGAGIVFISLISLFNQLGTLGHGLAFCFFLALFFAGITSAISMIEPLTSYMINNYKISRLKALFFIGFFVFVLGNACILSLNSDFSSMLSFFGKDFFTLLDKVTSNFLLPLGAIVSSIFVGFFMDQKKIYKIFSQFISREIFLVWLFFIRFISPVAIILVMCYQIFV